MIARVTTKAVAAAVVKAVAAAIQTKVAKIQTKEDRRVSGVGTELGKLIPEWLAKQSRGCGCNNWKNKCDAWGIEKCKANKSVIIKRLVDQRHMLPAAMKMLPTAALKAGATLLVEKAIANAIANADDPTDQP